MWLFLVLAAGIGACWAYEDNGLYHEPEQVHLAFGDAPNTMVVMWSTRADTSESVVQYGTTSMGARATGTRARFVDGGKDRRAQWIHRVQLKGLRFNATYVYHVGSQYAWSERLIFKTPPAGEDWEVRAVIYGDLGSDNARALPYLQADVANDLYDLVLHVGDFAYDLDSEQGQLGDQFMRQIQPIASSVPYMVCPGNHEIAYNFSHYKARFSMPGRHDNMYYSWNLGPVHFVAFSTEYYYENNATSKDFWWQSLKRQFEWIKADLSEAAKPENRTNFCYLGSSENECALPDVPQRQGDGLPEPGYGLEPLLKEYGVDLTIFGHEHSYERMWPLYDHQVYNGSTDQPYVNPKAPVHLVTGSAGCRENTYVVRNPKPWLAFNSSEYSYTKFKAYNKTHLYLEQISVDQDGKAIDSFWLVRDQHTSYSLETLESLET